MNAQCEVLLHFTGLPACLVRLREDFFPLFFVHFLKSKNNYKRLTLWGAVHYLLLCFYVLVCPIILDAYKSRF